ncbi:electron transfer flavoprotein subunit beta/FixA family protein [Candidatus Geothermarchaeota archaeon]|nr:MAG: electron transfer flavoprotein subunit beta/FixA family protein [Candidatus Geothermarchaeota archaeon]
MPLNIIVGIKWVPNTTSVNIDPKTGTLIREGIPGIVNPHDLTAVEFALMLKDRYGGTVTAVSMSPPAAVAGLEHLIGMGVDKAILFSDRVFAGADTLATSYVLAEGIKRIGNYDLIIMGHETIDSSTAHIGAQVASWLRLPYIYYVVDAEYREDERVLRVKRMLENAYEVYDIRLPALISIAMHTYNPRRVSLLNKIKAKKEKVIEVWSNQVLGLDVNCIGLRGSPTFLTKIEYIPKVPRKKERFEGKDYEEAARWLFKKLMEDGVLNLEEVSR